ncbi:hypothetical protein [Streptomyces beijiangensis]|uniref:Uncharacterized protein n=1 Tax=Streptomyces beijiangensis TaxID=163361 RepID=A0A939F7L8_9ACTN|nr:hypothetical protein [Streptomyces beijiangensis]MBO0513547.1 hypothetical protein [Streptomyces beijiangensis]
MSPRTAQAPSTSRWLFRGKDRRLTAYALTEGGVLRWTETRPGGPDWSGPDFIVAAGLTHLSLAQGPDGYVHLLARRRRSQGDDVMHAVQYQSGRAIGPWQSLGNPHTKDMNKARAVGVPAAEVNADGHVHIFLNNGNGAVNMRRQTKSVKWEGWKDLKGAHFREGMAAVVAVGGLIEMVAPVDKELLRREQAAPGGEFTEAEAVDGTPFPGSVAGLQTADDRATYYWSDRETPGIVAHRHGSDPVSLGGEPDEGPPALLRTPIEGHDCTVLAYRGRDGRPAIAACPTEAEADGLWWTPTGEASIGAPTLALDAEGRVVMAVIATDGTLRVARQKAEPGLALAAWAGV